MSLLQSILQAVQSWRRRRGGRKNPRRSNVALERLDHRQLLAVNFTGNVVNDFPATLNPGVVILNDNPSVKHPEIPPDIKPLIKVSGLDTESIRVTYTPLDDILNIGLKGPSNQKTGQDVIAGDVDNNLNSATVSPAVEAARPGEFIDFPDLGGSETMGAILDLNADGIPDIVAGISNDVGEPKIYQVAQAVVNPMMPNVIPGFGTSLPGNTGGFFLFNNPNNPDFELSISHFSELYQAETGQPLTADSIVNVGSFGNSNDDDGISEAFFPPQPVDIGQATIPLPPCPGCPPMEPRILINPHEARHVNTAHPTDVRVYIFGSKGFNVDQINPDTVDLDGAKPILHFKRHLNPDHYPDVTYVFRGSDIKLPPGITEATLTGQLFDGTEFSSTQTIFNRDLSFYRAGQIQAQEARQEARGPIADLTPFQLKALRHEMVDHAIADRQSGAETILQGGPTVSIRLRPGSRLENAKSVSRPVVPSPGASSGGFDGTVSSSSETLGNGSSVSIPLRPDRTPKPIRVVSQQADSGSTSPTSKRIGTRRTLTPAAGASRIRVAQSQGSTTMQPDLSMAQ